MNREQILSVLYDLSLTIGGEVDVLSLLRKTLQRLLFHTSFPAGVVLVEVQDSEFGTSATLEMAIGDYVLFREYVTRGPATDGSELVEPFEVIAIYSFEGDKCSRVEFVR